MNTTILYSSLATILVHLFIGYFALQIFLASWKPKYAKENWLNLVNSKPSLKQLFKVSTPIVLLGTSANIFAGLYIVGVQVSRAIAS